MNLPDKKVTLGSTHSGANAWWSNNDQDYGDQRLTRTIDVPTGSDVRFWSWDDYTIEDHWDYGFIEVSTDGGSNWTQLVVKDEAGNVVSTNEDPNGRLADFGNLKNGLTGATDSYRHDWVDLTPYAGKTVQLRLHYFTDAAFQERGWFADDFSVTDGRRHGVVRRRRERRQRLDGRGGDPDRHEGRRLEAHVRDARVRAVLHRRVAQLQRVRRRAALRVRHALGRRRRGADGGLHAVQRPRHAPVVPGLGLLEQRRGRPPVRAAEHRRRRAPSCSSTPTPNPEHYCGAAAAANPSLIDALPGRQQANDAAFGPVGRYPFQACFKTNPDPAKYYEVACNRFGRRGAVRRFTDAIGWYPGFEYRPDLDPDDPLFFRDVDASVVVPSKGNQIYSTRVTDKNGRLVRSQFGTGAR